MNQIALAFSIILLSGCGANALATTSDAETVVVLSSETGSERKVKLAWDPPFNPNVKGYRVYFGVSPGEYTERRDVALATSKTFAIRLLNSQTCYIAVKAYNSAGESLYSNEVSAKPH
jgi:hypothetical protein